MRQHGIDHNGIVVKLPSFLQKMLFPFGRNTSAPFSALFVVLINWWCAILNFAISVWFYRFSTVHIQQQMQFYRSYIPTIFAVHLLGLIVPFCEAAIWRARNSTGGTAILCYLLFTAGLLILIALMVFIRLNIPVLYMLCG